VARLSHFPTHRPAKCREHHGTARGPEKLRVAVAAGQTAPVVEVDAVVVGAGPNGLTAAATMARAGRRVVLFEAAPEIGGGTRTEELTLPGYRHDVCSAIHPLAAGSPAFEPLRLDERGLELVHPELALAHPLDGGRAAVLDRSWDATLGSLGPDAGAWRRSFAPLAGHWDALRTELLSGPLVHTPRHPIALARFGLAGLAPAATYARRRFRGQHARALFAGLAAHSILPLGHVATSAFARLLGVTALTEGWPAIRGGSQRLAVALADDLRAHGGEVVTGVRVRRWEELPPAPAVLFDTSPAIALEIARDRMPGRVVRALERFRPGPGVFKLDYALSEPVPWTAEGPRRSGTVHVGGTLDEIAAAEAEVGRGRHPERPFVLVAQQSLFDDTRAPAGRHTLWAYCHVPNGSTVDMTDAIERQIERFAPGFRDVVLARHSMGPADLERHNPNEAGGDIGGGSLARLQVVSRPRVAPDPYRLGPGLYLCSASTPPGAGVHGACGAAAARRALRRELSE
jgi:phytoene dehydrogenase-like protein